MLKRFLMMPAAVLLPVACSNAIPEAGDDARIVPERLDVTALAGGNGVLEVTALTLREGPRNMEVYAALRNDGDAPACSAAFSIELFDEAGQSLAAGISGLLTRGFYRLTDGSDAIAACVGPDEVAMAAVTDLPSDVAIDDVRHIVYRCPYFALDVAPVAGLAVNDLKGDSDSAGTAYTGTLVNELDVAVGNPSVTVFPVNRVGRPLGTAMANAMVAIPPGGRWTFETERVATTGVESMAYPAGALGN